MASLIAFEGLEPRTGGLQSQAAVRVFCSFGLPARGPTSISHQPSAETVLGTARVPAPQQRSKDCRVANTPKLETLTEKRDGAVSSMAPLREAEQSRHDVFEKTVLPYLNSAYNLARWLTRNEHDAEDIVQEVFLRALRSFNTFVPGRDPRAWLLAIVRNSCRTWQRQQRSHETTLIQEDSQPTEAAWSDPEALLIKNANSERIRQALEELPFEYREVLVLRELEELSYKEIADIAAIPLGTVMSRLSRARKELYSRLMKTTGEVSR